MYSLFASSFVLVTLGALVLCTSKFNKTNCAFALFLTFRIWIIGFCPSPVIELLFLALRQIWFDGTLLVDFLYVDATIFEGEDLCFNSLILFATHLTKALSNVIPIPDSVVEGADGAFPHVRVLVDLFTRLDCPRDTVLQVSRLFLI